MVNLWNGLIAAATLVCNLEVEDNSGVPTLNRSIAFSEPLTLFSVKSGVLHRKKQLYH